jgi:putative N6-adenine-specific DNA methylase
MDNKYVNFEMIAKTQLGLENVLAQELTDLGAQDVVVLNRAVSFVGDLGFMYKANLNLRTAIRILRPIYKFVARKEDDLYDGAKELDWSQYIDVNDTIAVNAAVNSDFFNHSHYVALKVKDAIVDFFRDLTKGKRPNVDTKNPDVRINVHISNDKVNISLDSSGDSLHKRGYRHATNIAPISEVLAAGMILLSDWDKESDFLDPMCGSGTLLIEAAMIACNIPPLLHRKSFGFMNWSSFDQELWETIKKSSLNKVKDFNGKIIGCDRSFGSYRKAESNIKDAMLDDIIELKRANFFRQPYLFETTGTILFNPPYGERIEADMLDLYSKIGDTFKNHYAGSTAWLITSDMDAVNSINLKHTRRIKLFNGQLECRFLRYQMYEGTKKLHKKTPQKND